jgi:ABC-2 type transport system permease protein
VTTVSFHAEESRTQREKLAYYVRVLRVFAMVDFKLKYLDSVLGYIWALGKPLSYFAVIWALLGGLFKAGVPYSHYPLFLLLGIILYGWFVDSVGMSMSSIVARSELMRRVSFPRIVVPLAATATAGLTFVANVLVAAVFIAISGITPGWDWLLIPPLLLEEYLTILGLGLLLATVYTRVRDIAPLWDLVAQLLLFAMPVMYSITVMPYRVQQLLLLNPVAQVMQDVRAIILDDDGSTSQSETIAGVYGAEAWRLLPVAIAVGLFVVGLRLFRRSAPKFAESL